MIWTAAIVAVGGLLGWLTASGRFDAKSSASPERSGEPAKPEVKNAVPDAKKPNSVFVLMDDLGYGEVGCYGGGILRGAPTARIDKLAVEGTRLLNFNVEAQCTPSRSAIITGRYAVRSGTHSVPMPGQLDGLTRWEVTIAELLSAQGYATAHFGKWHLGSDQSRLPTSQGFDEWYGIPRTTDEAFWQMLQEIAQKKF